MAPGLLAGDWITAVPSGPEAVKRGARLVFHAWDGTILVKRVVGLPGDTIAMRNDTLTIGGRLQREPYIYTDPHGDSSARSWGPLVVPPESVFVLGDNRGNSSDSRDRGFVARNAFFQRPTGIYFSRDLAANRIRWRRLGIRIE